MPEMRDRLTGSQLAVLTASTILGVSYLFLPRLLAEKAGRDGWLPLLLGGFLILGLASLLVALGLRFPGQTFFQYSRVILGPYFGSVYNLLVISHFTLASAWVTRVFGDILKTYLLERTPLEITVLSLLFTTAYLVGHGLNALARFDQVAFPLLLAPILLLLALAQVRADYSELLPFFTTSLKQVVLAIPISFTSYIGYGVVAFTMPYLFRPQRALPAALIGVAIPLLLYLLIFISCVAVLGADYLPHLIFPVVDLARSIEVPGAFLERVEVLLLAHWTLTAFTTVAALYYFALLGLTQSLGFKEHRHLVYLGLPILYFLALRPGNLPAVTALGDVIKYLGLAASGGLLLLFLVAVLRGLKGGGGDGEKGEEAEAGA